MVINYSVPSMGLNTFYSLSYGPQTYLPQVTKLKGGTARIQTRQG